MYEMCLKGNATGVMNNVSLFKVIPLKCNALFHPSMLRFYALLKRIFWDDPQLRYDDPPEGLLTFKKSPLELKEKPQRARSDE